MVIITKCPSLFSVGWGLPKELADFRKDYLLPSRTTKLQRLSPEGTAVRNRVRDANEAVRWTEGRWRATFPTQSACLLDFPLSEEFPPERGGAERAEVRP